jgi:hypothetical protein
MRSSCVVEGPRARRHRHKLKRESYYGPYFSTFTPFQNATYPLICFAADFGSG